MNVSTHADADSLSFTSIVRDYINNPRFLRRSWLASEVETLLADPTCRFVLITAEPGFGKSSFMAQLAHDHPKFPRYFIRRDQTAALGPAGARSLLLHIGLQLAVSYPQIFASNRLELTIRQRLGTVSQDATVIGAEVQRLISSPFHQAALEIIQEVERTEGHVTGLHVGEWVTDPRLIPLDDLQHLALLDPAASLHREIPDERVVILIDALDELRYQDPSANLLGWLANVPPLPANVRLVLTSRPDDDLLRTLRRKQAEGLRELSLDLNNPQVHTHLQADLASYARQLVDAPIAVALETVGRAPAEFVATAVTKAEGNLGYLDAVARSIEQAQLRNEQALLETTLLLEDLPATIENLYAFFLQQVKGQVSNQTVSVEDPQTGARSRSLAWPAIYGPILGILSVAREPLTAEQIMQFGTISANWSDFNEALNRLRQFLDEVGGRYRFYHTTLPEFITRASTRNTPEVSELYQDAPSHNQQLVGYYRQLVGGWADANWAMMDDYGWRHLTAHAMLVRPAQPTAALFELCDSGFLEAKHHAVVSAALLEDDWNRALHACRTTGDFLRFVRYGLQRSRQFRDVGALQNTQIARTAARLAVRHSDPVAVDRLANEIALIPHPLARIHAQQALLDALIDANPAHPVVEALFITLRSALNMLPAAADRERFTADLARALKRAQWRDWQVMAREYLDEATSLVPRVTILAALATGQAASGNQFAAGQLLRQALAECQQFALRDDILPLIFEGIFGDSRVDPAELLAIALYRILEGVPVLSPTDCAAIIAAMQNEFARIDNSMNRLLLEISAVEASDASGLRDVARQKARDLLDRYLRTTSANGTDASVEPAPDRPADAVPLFESASWDQMAVHLLVLLPIVSRFGITDDLNRWHQCFNARIEKISSADGFLQVAHIAEGVSRTTTAAPDMDQALRQISAHAPSPTLPEMGFAVGGSLAASYAHIGEHAQACRIVTDIIDQDGAAGLGSSEYPEQASGRTRGMAATWEAACISGEPALIERTLAWLQATVPTALPLDEQMELWIAAISALDDLDNLDLAQELFDRLKLQTANVNDTGEYFSTACLQFADAYVGLTMPDAAGRFIIEGVQVARATLAEEPLIRILAEAGRLTALLDDPGGSANFLDEAFQLIPSIDGENIKAYFLQLCLPAVGVLAQRQPSTRATAERLLVQAAHLAEQIELDRSVVSTLAAIVRLDTERRLAGHNPVPTKATGKSDLSKFAASTPAAIAMPEARRGSDGLAPALAHHAHNLLDTDTPDPALQTVMTAIHALHQAGADRAADELLQQVTENIERKPRATDHERASVCEAYADLIGLHSALGRTEQSIQWRDLTITLARHTREPGYRTDACLSAARIEALFADAAGADAWLAEAIAAWHQIEERLHASWRIGPIFSAWTVIPDDDVRYARLPTMNAVLWRIPDLDERDAWQLRLAFPFWHDPARFRSLTAPVSDRVVNTLLAALNGAEVVPEGILPETLYELLEKSSRQLSGIAAGNCLLATQAGVRHQALTAEVAVPVLKLLEAAIRDIAAADLGLSST